MEASPVCRPGLNQQKPYKAEGRFRHTPLRNFYFVWDSIVGFSGACPRAGEVNVLPVVFLSTRTHASVCTRHAAPGPPPDSHPAGCAPRARPQAGRRAQWQRPVPSCSATRSLTCYPYLVPILQTTLLFSLIISFLGMEEVELWRVPGPGLPVAEQDVKCVSRPGSLLSARRCPPPSTHHILGWSSDGWPGLGGERSDVFTPRHEWPNSLLKELTSRVQGKLHFWKILKNYLFINGRISE